MPDTRRTLAALGLLPSEIEVYLALLGGARSVRDILRVTRQKRPTVYYALDRLLERGLVSRTGRVGTDWFSAEPADRLRALVQDRERSLKELADDVTAILPALQAKPLARTALPAVSFFEGAEAVKGTIMESLYCRTGRINSVAPRENFFWQVGRAFVVEYIEERARRRIRTRNLWEAPTERLNIKQYYTELSEVRILPSVMRGKFATTTFLYDDKTLYVSSLKNAYALLVRSQEHHDTIQTWFDGLWTSSTPHPA